MNEADNADKESEVHLAVALQRARAEATSSKLNPKGCCYYCSERFSKNDPLASSKLFCDSDCARWQDEEDKARRRRTGGA